MVVAVLLRLVTVFVLGLAIGSAVWFALGRDRPGLSATGPASPEVAPAFGGGQSRTGDGWGRVVVRASTGRDLWLGRGPSASSSTHGDLGTIRDARSDDDRGSPLDSEDDRKTLDPTSQPISTAVSPPRSAPPLPDFEHTVRPGQTLSQICADHYGSAAPRLVSALSAYNGLADPNALRSGTTVRLPERSLLAE